MFKTLRDAWRIPELRKKLIATIVILLIYRVIAAVPVPFLIISKSNVLQTSMNDNLLGLYNTMSGGALGQASILALGIQPYINASIIIQLLSVAIPPLERLAKEGGEEGKKKIEKITRVTTFVLGLLLGYGTFTMCKAYGLIAADIKWYQTSLIVILLAAGSSLAMWLGEQITENGIGNGISMILFANIIVGLPQTLETTLNLGWWAIAVGVILLALIVFIVFINDAERRIPIQYAKRTVGRKIMGGQSTNLPIKVAMSGVMPVIFAQSIVSIGGMVMQFIASGKGPAGQAWMEGHVLYKYLFSPRSAAYAIIYFLLIFFFSWFYSTIQYDPTEISKNLQKNGGFIPGFRAGKPTANFIKKVINKILIFGAIYLAIVALLPVIAGIVWKDAANLSIGGTSIIIVVGVALETVKAIEAQMLMRHYKGFLD